MRRTLLLAWTLALGTAGGAVVAAERPYLWPAALVVLSIAFAFGTVRRRQALTVLAVLLAGAACGAVAASVRADDGASLTAAARRVPRCAVVGQVLEQVGALGTLAAVTEARCDRGVGTVHEGVAALETDALPGSPFRATGWLVPLRDDAFDVALARAGADASFSGTVESAPPQGWYRVAANVRHGLRAGFERRPSEARALLLGLSVGDTDPLSPLVLDHFRTSGLSHLVAVSGSNVAIVVGAAALVTRRLAFSTRIAAAVLTLVVFISVVGPDASVLRAAAMGALAIAALALGRQSEPLHALALGIALLIVVRPQIVFSIGFHLSAAATAGIVMWTNRLERRALWLPRLIRLPLALTLAAQAAVAPLLLGTFGEISLVAPITNLLAAPAVPPATIAGFVGALVSPLSPSLGSLALTAGEPFAAWTLLVARIGAGPTWASVELWRGLALVAGALAVVGAVVTLRRYGEPISLDR